MSHHSHGIFDHAVTCSNWAYFIPIAVVLFLFNKYPNIHILLALLTITLLTSTSYHMCRGSGDTMPQNHVCDHKTPVCRVRCQHSTLYELRDGDYLVAILTAVLIFLTVVPLKTWFRVTYFMICFVWLIEFLDSDKTYSDSHMTRLCAPLFPIVLIVIAMPFLFRRNSTIAHLKFLSWVMSIVVFIIAIACFQNVFDTPYHTHHSHWHYFSALAMALILFATQQNSEHIDLDRLDKYGLGVVKESVFNTSAVN